MLKTLVTSGTVLSTVLLSACYTGPSQNTASTSTTTSSSSANSGDKVTITWWDYNSPDPTVKALQKMISDYEKLHPNVKIERTYVPFADLKNKLVMGAAAGQLPDIVWIDSADNQAFGANGTLADITKEVQAWGQADQYFSGPWSSTLYKGKNYGIPSSSNNLALFYNEDMLNQAGIKPPTNWEELKSSAKKLTKTGVYGFAASAVKSEQGSFQFLPYVWQAGSDIPTFNSQGTLDAIKLWKDMVDNGSMSKEVIGWDQQAVELQFASGNVAMMENGTWQIPALQKDAKFKWGVVPLPAGKQGGTILGGENWAITAASKHKDLAWDIIKFSQQPEQLKPYVQAAGRLPSRKDLIKDPAWQDDKSMKVFADSMEFAKARAYGPKYPDISIAIQNMIQEVLTGTKSPEDAVKEADTKIKPLLP